MVEASRGFRRGTRRKLKVRYRQKFKPNTYMQQFKYGDKVIIKPDPSSHSGMPFPKFKGLIGVVSGKRGKAFIIKIKTGGKEKTIISKPEHLKPLK